MMEAPRCSISELHYGKFTANDFHCWRFNYRIDVCVQTRFPSELTKSCMDQRSGDGEINGRSGDVAVN